MTTLIYFSQEFLDERTADEVIGIELGYAKKNINSMEILLSNLLLKLQVDIQQIIALYQNIAKSISNSSDFLNLTDIDVYNPYELREKMKSKNETFMKRLSYASLWFIDNENINIIYFFINDTNNEFINKFK